MAIIKRANSPKLEIKYRQDASVADYIPLAPNPGEAPPVIPITGVGDMFRSIYDQDINGVVDRVDEVQISGVVGLQQILNDLANQGGGGGASKEIIQVTNNGTDTFLSGNIVSQNNGIYVIGSSVPPRHRILGLAIEPSAPGEPLRIQLSGYFNLPAQDWDLVTDSVGGLAINTTYYASSNARLTANAPTQSPDYLIKIGSTISQNAILIDIDLAIKL